MALCQYAPPYNYKYLCTSDWLYVQLVCAAGQGLCSDHSSLPVFAKTDFVVSQH